MKNISTSGTRKRAVARAVVSEGKGHVRINSVNLNNFGNSITRERVREPLLLVPEIASKINIDIIVNGGGYNGQADAARVAIGRALSQYGGESIRKLLTDYDRSMIVSDVRRKETRKPNDSKARAKRQKSYR